MHTNVTIKEPFYCQLKVWRYHRGKSEAVVGRKTYKK